LIKTVAITVVVFCAPRVGYAGQGRKLRLKFARREQADETPMMKHP
jgi:hypothetical protein